MTIVANGKTKNLFSNKDTIMEKEIINEMGRLTVSVPTASWRSAFLHLVKDENEDWKIINFRDDEKGFNEKSGVELATYVRAILTVRSKLLVQGRAIKPESYIALWRETEILTIEKLLSKHGITIQLNCKFDLEAERSNKWNQTSHQGSDLESFADFEERYKQYFNGSEFTLQLTDGKQSGDFLHMVYNFVRLSPGYVAVSNYSVSIVESGIKAEVAGIDEMAQQFDFFGEPA